MNNNEKIIEKAKQVHGDKYDYSLVDYINCRTKVKIICKEHGVFEQTPNNHLMRRGCPKCKIDKISNALSYSQKDFIKKAKQVHGDKYDYSKSIYKGYHVPVIIICKKHGEFLQKPSKHISRKHGCFKCSIKNKIQCQPLTTEEFIKKAKKIHGDKYDYSLVDYKNYETKVKIICKEHGVFEQTPNNHLMRRGCPKCKTTFSYNEKELLKFIKENYNGLIIENDKNIIKPMELDIYLPDLKLAFEYNGLYWHNELEKFKNYHLMKTNLCEKQGVHLVHIYEDDWNYKQDIIKSMILNLLGKSNKIYARECKIKKINYRITKKFLDENYIYGYCNSKYNLGLYYDNELVTVMTFNKLNKKNHYELLRFCSKLNTVVIGGANKLFSYFKENYKPKYIISYANRSWTMNNGNTLYDKLGFKYLKNIKPSYYYIINNKKEKIFDKENISKFNKYIYKIYDSGKLKYEWNS